MENQKRHFGKAKETQSLPPHFTAFEGDRCIASGTLAEVVRATNRLLDKGQQGPVLIFDDESSELIEIDFRGSPDEVVARLSRSNGAESTIPNNTQRQGPGRPRLGVIAREITLLPGHWDWLDTQPGGASAALRRLVHEAKRSSHEQDRARRNQEAVYRFMTAMAGNLPGYEEALRAYYRKDVDRFESLIKSWSRDIRRHINKLMALADRT